MRARNLRRRIALVAALGALASCDALVGISDTSVAHGGAGGADASADAGAGAGGLDASVEADAETGTDAIADAPSDQNVGPLPSHGLGCAFWPGNEPVTVGCPAGQVITGFSTALYGTPTGSCNGGDAGPDGGGAFQSDPSCNAPDAKPALEDLCDGLSSCTFTADANLDALAGDAGDPCPGTSKFVALQVECGQASTEAGTDAGTEGGTLALPAGEILDLDAAKFSTFPVGSTLPNNHWDDSSGNQLDATSGGTTTPTIGLDQPSGLGLVQLSGNDQYFTLPSISANFAQGFTAFAVVAPENLRTWQGIFDFGNGQAHDNVLLLEHKTSRALDFQIYLNNSYESASSPGTFDTDELQLFAVRATPASGSTSLLKVTTYKGGAPVYEQFMLPPNNVTRANNFIGSSSFPNALFQGYMGQLVVYDRGLSGAEMSEANRALISKWKLCTAADTQSDPANCGYCGHLCAPGQRCLGGVCIGSLISDCSSFAVTNNGSGYDYPLCQGRNGNKVSWVQARNACVDMDGDLMSLSSKSTSNTVGGGGPLLVGLTDYGTNQFYWSDGSPVSFSAWSGDGGPPPTDQESCAEVSAKSGGSVWHPVSCLAPQTDPWLCKLPEPTPSCDTWSDPATGRVYAICNGAFASDQMRRDVCAAMNGTLLTVQPNEATNLGALLERFGGNLPNSAIDLTDGATPLDWTLENGATAPYVSWLSGEPQVGSEPRCATLSTSGQLATAPCNGTAEPVICSLPNGTQLNETLGSVASSVSLNTGYIPVSASVSLDGNGNEEPNVTPNAKISAKVTLKCSSLTGLGALVPIRLSFSPGFSLWNACANMVFECSFPQGVSTKTVHIQAPPIAGVFDLGIQGMRDISCTKALQPPQVFGRIGVAAP